MAARGAAVGAEVADVDRVVAVRLPAADAVLRVGRVLEAEARARRVVDAVEQRAGAAVRQRADQRVVRIGDQRRLGRECLDRAPPPFRDVLEPALTVQLVPDQVAEADDPGARAAHHLV